MTQLKACAVEKCALYGKRFEMRDYCTECGQKLLPMVSCCAKETIMYDEGFCGYCGKLKALRFQLEAING